MSSFTCNDQKLTTVFDMDETMGAFGAGSIAFKLCLKYTGRVPDKAMFVAYYLLKGGARPWLKQMLQTLERWKRIGRIGVVAIFTAADNKNGWVTFIKDCLELYAETPSLFSRILTREDLRCVQTQYGKQIVKDLSLVSPDAESVVLIDDKPANVLNGYVIRVAEYRQHVDITDLKEWLKATISDHKDDIETIFKEDALLHPSNGVDYSRDADLFKY